MEAQASSSLLAEAPSESELVFDDLLEASWLGDSELPPMPWQTPEKPEKPARTASQVSTQSPSFFQRAQAEARSLWRRDDDEEPPPPRSEEPPPRSQRDDYVSLVVEPADAGTSELMRAAGYEAHLELQIPKNKRNRLTSTYNRLKKRWASLADTHDLVLGSDKAARRGRLLYKWRPADKENQLQSALARIRQLEAELRATKAQLKKRESSPLAQQHPNTPPPMTTPVKQMPPHLPDFNDPNCYDSVGLQFPWSATKDDDDASQPPPLSAGDHDSSGGGLLSGGNHP